MPELIPGLDELHRHCVRRGWRLRLTADTHRSPLRVARLEVRERCSGELLASVGVADGLAAAAVGCARSLDAQGLIVA